jgi:hypothetical protein
MATGGSSSSTRMSCPVRSRTVLRYSTRFNRRTVTRPGSGFAGSRPKAECLIHFSSFSCSAAERRGFFSGGISPARTFFNTFDHSSGLSNSASFLNSSKLTSPFFAPSAWQSEQYSLRMGAMSRRNCATASTPAARSVRNKSIKSDRRNPPARKPTLRALCDVRFIKA